MMVCKPDARVAVATDQQIEAHQDTARIHLFGGQVGCNVTLERAHVAHAS
jgi:hypothetical protein